MREAFAELMVEIGSNDEKLVVLVGDISHGILQPFARDFKERYYNIGICEPTIVNMSAGLSKVGLNPVVHTIAPFLIERSYEQIKLDFGYQQLGINLVSVGGAFDYSQLGCSHHCYTDVSLMCHIENSQVFVPGSADEFKSLFRQSYNDKKINYFRLTENPHNFDTKTWHLSVGKGIVFESGSDVTIATTGAQLTVANEASRILNQQGIHAEILYFPTLKPFDFELIRNSATKTRRLITLEEISAHDGLFNLALRATVGIADLRTKQLAISGFLHGYGNYHDLCNDAGLTADSVVKQAQLLLANPNGTR